MQSKAVLEFYYPEDEDKLLFALKGQEMYKALLSASKALITSSPIVKES